jgi:4-amino-4-deoxy-L-arabinose transferase-like glycosyltransferase
MSEPARGAREWWIAVALAASFAFTGLANHALQDPDEPRVAGIAWEMQHTGDWWIPHLSGAPFLEHPPLFYTVLAGFIRALGATDAVARLPGAIASFLTALLVFALARRVADRSAGIPALLALIGIAGFAGHSHRVVVDPLLMLFATCGYYAYARAVFTGADRADPRWLGAVYVAAALAFWVKGPIGVIAIAGPLAIEALWARRSRMARSPAHWVGLPLLVAACAAWPLVLYLAGGEPALQTYLLNNVWYRIAPAAAAGQYVGGHQNPFWYYGPKLFGQLGWTVVLLPAVAAWLWRGAAPAGWNVPALRLLACVFPIGVLLLSIPGTKRALYLLPFEPPLAVAFGAWIAAAGRADPLRSRAEAAITTLCAWITRTDLAAAATGACRAPYRVAMLGFACAIAWNAVGLRFVDRDREFAPMVRALDERVGSDTVIAVSPSESLLGALAFYEGRIPLVSHDLGELDRQLAQSDARFVLAPIELREPIAAALGGEATFDETLTSDNDDYVLFAVSPTVAKSQVTPSQLMSN